MNNSTSHTVYYRLIALWVLCEAMLGGIIHGFRIPVSGLVVGSCAVVCICLIAWYAPQKGNIVKATLIVAIFKMMLSPQAPLPAYIAVFFQGLLGELLFHKRRFYTLSCILLATLSLLESGLQRILVLTIVYGNDLWSAVNDFINKLTKQKQVTNYSFWIAGGYVILHVVTGLLVGWWATLLPARISKWSLNNKYRIGMPGDAETLPVKQKRKQTLKRGLLIVWLLLIVLYVQSYFRIGEPLLPSHVSLKILLRSLIIVLGWIFLIGPLLTRLLHNWLRKRQSYSQKEVQEILRLLPGTRSLIAECWKRSANQKVSKRLSFFAKAVLVNSLAPLSPGGGVGSEVCIFTAPVQSGKTTSLVQWAEKRKDVYGILTPVINGKRFFVNAATKEQWPMEAEEGEESLGVGRFVFSKKGFEKAIAVIHDAVYNDGWLVIDEIGPLELRGEGFCEILKKLLSERTSKTVLVVREGLQQQVTEKFGIAGYAVIKTATQLLQKN